MENILYVSKTDKFSYSHAYTETPCNTAHWHHNAHNEIIIFLQGNCKFTVEGTTYFIKPLDAVVIRSVEMHRVYHLEPISFYERIVLHIPDSFFVKNDCEDLKQIFVAHPLGENNLVSGELVQSGHIPDVIKMIEEYITEYETVPENVLRGKLVELLFHLNMAHRNTFKESFVDDTVKNIIIYLNRNIEQKMTLDGIAEQFFMSKSRLCHMFKEHTGITVNQYIQQKRFIRVKELAAEGVPLSAACKRAGFGTYSNFYKLYQKENGIAPKKVLKK